MRSRSVEVRRARPLLGTFVEIVVPEPGPDTAGAIGAAFAEIEEVQRRMSFHDPASGLSKMNRLAATVAVPVDAWTFEVLQMAAAVHRVSAGVFDVTIAPRLQALGFLPGTAGAGSTGSFDDVELTADGCVRFHHPRLRIDLGGIAKGFAVDRAVASLRQAGVESGLVNAGGDLRAFGAAAFPVALRHPATPGAMLASFPARDCAVATSAHYYADRLVRGAGSAPIVHPRGEREPALAPALARTATVRASSAMVADALTKVVMLCAEDALPALAHFGAEALFVSDAGELTCTKNWNATLHIHS